MTIDEDMEARYQEVLLRLAKAKVAAGSSIITQDRTETHHGKIVDLGDVTVVSAEVEDDEGCADTGGYSSHFKSLRATLSDGRIAVYQYWDITDLLKELLYIAELT